MTALQIEVTLDSLLGDHVLEGVDTYIERVNTYGVNFEDANVVRFCLDGVTYTAIENPTDDYRSSLDKLFVDPNNNVKNIFPPTNVTIRKRANEKYSINDTIEMVDKTTGKVVLAVGTDNTEDYYPYFVGEFNPQNMAINAGTNE